MKRVGKENSDPITDLASFIQDTGYNKDVHLDFARVLGLSPVKVRLESNGLETTSLILMNHLHSQYYPVHIVFNDELGTEEREGQIFVDSGIQVGDRVSVMYDKEGATLKGFIIGKEDE